jgi:hypothetical protein
MKNLASRRKSCVFTGIKLALFALAIAWHPAESLAAAKGGTRDSSKPNVLFIATDDLALTLG